MYKVGWHVYLKYINLSYGDVMPLFPMIRRCVSYVHALKVLRVAFCNFRLTPFHIFSDLKKVIELADFFIIWKDLSRGEYNLFELTSTKILTNNIYWKGHFFRKAFIMMPNTIDLIISPFFRIFTETLFWNGKQAMSFNKLGYKIIWNQC